jgi:hypothetical protein
LARTCETFIDFKLTIHSLKAVGTSTQIAESIHIYTESSIFTRFEFYTCIYIRLAGHAFIAWETHALKPILPADTSCRVVGTARTREAEISHVATVDTSKGQWAGAGVLSTPSSATGTVVETRGRAARIS